MREEKNISVVIEESEQETKVPLIFQIVIEIVLGIFLIIYRDTTTNILFIVIGSLMAAYGAFDLIAFVTNNRNYSFRRGLTTGVLITIIGVAFIVQAEQLKNLLAIIIGALILIESIVNCRRSLIIKNLGAQRWYILFAASLAAVTFGIVICIYPNLFGEVISLIMGIAVLIEALLDLLAIFGITVIRGSIRKKMHNSDDHSLSIIDINEKK
ncbi:MAG TPA: hypothetical protein DDX72_01430 [Ruminococcaceae bacterium]|nr:hypothetical protein [Oscillospiraceae bacterium]